MMPDPDIVTPDEPVSAPSSRATAVPNSGGNSVVPGPVALPRVGDRLESFEILDILGSGGMGAVYLASDLRLDRLVALKLLPPEQASDSDTVLRFEQEGRAAARLDHENIARVYTLGCDRGFHFIVFEYINGTTVKQRLGSDGAIPAAEAVRIALQISAALVHSSERGVVHRDIKPSNIIVTARGEAKLVDMGLARSFERDARDAGLTQSGVTLGTFDYISPEQARDPRDVDVRSDLYSLGCTLFQMLTGQPPFPEGTVLQKLLLHQEQPAPDPRSINPNIPALLSAIVLRLLEKDRERRYQRPEDLAVALESVAAELGVAVAGRPSHVTPQLAGWEKYLTWSLPAVGFAAMLGLFFIATHGDGNANRGKSSTDERGAPRLVAQEPAPNAEAATTSESSTNSGTGQPVSRDILVGSLEDLGAALAKAPPHATIVLTDDGPYRVGPTPLRDLGTASSLRRDLLLKAAAKARPIVRAARTGESVGESALLSFESGHVRLEGIEFVLDGRTTTAIHARDTHLSVNRCIFRREGEPANALSPVALRLEAGERASADGAPSIRVTSSTFDVGILGVRVVGPSDVAMRDSSFGPDEPIAWFDNSPAPGPVPARLALRHVSVLVGEAPVVRLGNTLAQVMADDSVFAAPTGVRGTLVSTDQPGLLDWLGRENLYGRIGVYLQPQGATQSHLRVASFTAWADAPGVIRELRSVATDAHIWVQADPRAALARREWSNAYELSLLAPGIGVRQGPRGLPPRFNTMLGELLESARAPLPSSNSLRSAAQTREPSLPFGFLAALDPRRRLAGGEAARVNRATTTDTTNQGNQPMPMIPVTNSPMPEAATQPMAQAPGEMDPGGVGVATSNVSAAPGDLLDRDRTAVPGRLDPNNRVQSSVTSPPPVVETASELRRRLEELGPKGGEIHLASDARLVLDPVDLERKGRWSLVGEPGLARPRISLRPERRSSMPFEPNTFVRVGSGASIELRGIDIVLPSGMPDDIAVFTLAPGADLSLARCTLTVVGASGRAEEGTAVVRIVSADEPASASAAATIRFEDCLIRAGGNIVDSVSGGRVEASVINSLVVCGGSVVHGRGNARTATAAPLKLALRQSTLQAASGLLWLESTAGQPELPQAEIVARESILSTGSADAPLVRVDGQQGLDELRDRVSWEGHGVVYHQINTYRRDDSSQAGTLPLGFRRLSWEVAVGPREEEPYHGDARFLRPWPSGRAPWTATPEDFRLTPSSPAAGAGPQINQIAVPPRLDE